MAQPAPETPPVAAPEPTAPAVAAAEATAAEGGSQAQAERAAAREEQSQRPELTATETKAIASGIVDELDERGMFDHAEPEPAIPPTPAEPAPASAGSAAEPASSGPDEAPKKTSWAAKFLRDKGGE